MNASVDAYENSEELFPAEQAALSEVEAEVRGASVLDLGVGAGRTVKALRALCKEYVGLDYTQGMVDKCRERYPDGRFVQGDARDLSQFGDGTFSLVFFSCTGIGMVDHAGRLSVLREVHRVLKPGGVFIFSTGNRDCVDHRAFFRLPDFHPTLHPVRMLKRSAAFCRDLAKSLKNRMRLKRFEEFHEDYCIINDIYHNYATMIYYISESKQHEQLRSAGFAPGSKVFDNEGPVTGVSRDNDMTFVARKPA